MTTLKTFRVVAVLISLLMFTSVVLAQPPPRLATIDYPGGSDTFASGINPAGDIVGGYFEELC
jgi:hypothetical protein